MRFTLTIAVFVLFYGLLVMFNYRTKITPRIRPKAFPKSSNKLLSPIPTAEEYVRQIRFDETHSRPGQSTASGNISSEGRSSYVAVLSNSSIFNHACQWRVQFWGKLKLSLEEGDYYCPESDCTVQFITRSDYNVMKTSHVVLLHHRGNWSLQTIASIRRPDQVLAYWTRETPGDSRKKLISGISTFNWTVTYSSKSEVQIPYGSIERYQPTESVEATQARTKNWAEGKTSLAIWISSNCHTAMWRRTNIVKTLGKFMNIDTFGKCGNQPCKKHCLQRIFSYKFYIAFENSCCEDYITEKLWRNALMHGAVPIVYGAPKQDYERLAPKHSFIHISDFSNISSLASYIKLLDQNDTLYNEFFEWRRDYRVEQLSEDEVLKKESLCSISKQLLNLRVSHNTTTGSVKWFTESCHTIPIPEMV